MTQFSTFNKAFKKGNKAAAWLYAPAAQRVLALLEGEGPGGAAGQGGEARVIGGAVRDTLLGRPVSDIDIATTLPPEAALARAKAAGLRAVPYAPQFGTVLILAGGQSFQITTLREDVETDGRHAIVRFCRDWAKDSGRRDFTINAMSVDKEGRLYDYQGGLADLAEGRLRFIGEPEERIKEDYLRIMRFFRFYALLPRGRPDPAALKAIAALKSGLSSLSPERIWGELKRLLAADNPLRALLWMRAAGVLSQILPESEKWGIDALQGLMQLEAEEGEKRPPRAAGAQGQDYLLRLMAMIPPREPAVKQLAARLSLSRAEKQRLLAWARQMPLKAEMSEAELRRRIYAAAAKAGGKAGAGKAVGASQPLLDALRIAAANARIYGKTADEASYARLRQEAESWIAPQFPVSGADLAARGLSGAALGNTLKQLEKSWLESDFTLSKEELLRRVSA